MKRWRYTFSILLTMTMLICFTSQVAFCAEASEDSEIVKGTGVSLTIYTNGESDGRGDWLIERAAQDGFDLQILGGGGGEIHDRLVAEKEAPFADVTFELNGYVMADLKSQDILEPYVPVWADLVDPAFNDSEGYYHALKINPIVMAYDQNQMSAEEAPKDILELGTNEAYNGRYQFNNSMGAGVPRILISSMLVRFMDPEGEYGVSEEGWEYIAAYFKNGVKQEEGMHNYAAMANPDSPVCITMLSANQAENCDKEFGTDTVFIVPEVGLPYATECIGIVKGTKNLEEAQRFVDWFGSAQIQGEWSKEFNTLPANRDGQDAASEFAKSLGTYPAQDVDWDFVAEYIDEWCEKIELEYMP